MACVSIPAGYLIAGGAVAGAGISALGSTSAASTQAGAQEQAAQTQLQMFNTINQQEQPFIQGGYGALNELLYGLGLNGGGPSYPGASSNTGQFGGAAYDPYAPGPNGQGLFTSGYNGNFLAPGPGTTPVVGGSAPILGATGLPVGAGVAGLVGNQFTPSGSSGPRATLAQTMAMGGPASRVPGSSAIPSGTGATTGAMPSSAPSPGGALTPGQFTSNFTPADLYSNLSPGFGFQLQTGGQAVRNADTPTQGALSGATLKDLMSFNQGLASTSYQQAFNNWQSNTQNIFSRLSAIAGLGQNAASNVGTSGTQLGTGIAQAQAAAGGSLAGGIVGATNAASGAASSIPLAYLLAGQQSGGGGGGFNFNYLPPNPGGQGGGS